MVKSLGEHALVTGASRGLGPVIAGALADEGVNVTLTARNADGLEVAAASIGDRVRVETVPVDLRDHAATVSLVAEAQARLGPIDVLVNNAAVDHYVAFRAKSADQMREEIETNLLAPLHLTRLVLDEMLERGTGHIVNIGSLAAKTGLPYEATYSATKAGLVEWANALRAELHGTGVGVSVVMPSVIGDVGVFSRQGVEPPRLATPVTGKKVAQAVLRAIRDDVAEVIVASGPTRPLLAVDALWPSFGNWFYRRSGINGMMAELAARAERASHGGTAPGDQRLEPPGAPTGTS